MLIDFIEETAGKMRQLRRRHQDLGAQYRKYYSRDVRDEMAAVQADIARLRRKACGNLYLGPEELSLIKKHFPDFFRSLAEDEDVGSLIREKEWLLGRKEESAKAAEKKAFGHKGAKETAPRCQEIPRHLAAQGDRRKIADRHMAGAQGRDIRGRG